MNRVRLVVLAAVLTGCSDRPKAPALGDEPVYESVNEGFRFAVPQGWRQTARSELPPGPLDKERMLVRYHGAGIEKSALEVTMLDLPESADLANHLAGPTHSVSDWKPVGQPQPAAGTGTRYQFSGSNSTKDVIAFRRGGRVYLFTIVAGSTDAKTRELALKAVEGVVWTK